MASLLYSCMFISTLNIKLEPEHTHRVQTHAVLLLTLTLMLTFEPKTISPVFQPKTMSLVRYPKVIPYTKF